MSFCQANTNRQLVMHNATPGHRKRSASEEMQRRNCDQISHFHLARANQSGAREEPHHVRNQLEGNGEAELKG